MTNTISVGYKKQNDSEFITSISRVVTKTDGNPNFQDPPEELAIVKKTLPEFGMAVTDASGRDQMKIAIKNEKRAIIEQAVGVLRDYVWQVANGDRVILLSSGFELRGSRKGAALGTVTVLEVIADKANEATTRVKRVRNARAYIHQYTVDPVTPDSVWIKKFHTEPEHTFTGLVSREKYVFQVIAIGNKGQEAPSPVMGKVIQ
jgi:hypothetical protein